MTLSQKRICVSGKLSMTRKEVEAKIIGAGGVFAKSCSGKTQYLVTTAQEVTTRTSKVTDAIKHGIAIVSEAWLEGSIASCSLIDTGPFLLLGGGDASVTHDAADADADGAWDRFGTGG